MNRKDVTNDMRIRLAPDTSRNEKVRSWRRRVLLRRGVKMRAGMGADAGNCSLAMLDELGVVVAWYGHAGSQDRAAEDVLDHHVSQFYPPEAVAINQPVRDLHSAVVAGSHTREGWRRRPDGMLFWAVTVIDAFVLRDGRLQGFSYVTTTCDGPSAAQFVVQSAAASEASRELRASAMGMYAIARTGT